MKLKFLPLCLVGLLEACTSMGQLNESAKAPSQSESVFIIGVAPENYRISVFPGSVSNGIFWQSTIRSAAVYGAGKNGYVVGRASAGDVLAITNVRVVKGESSIWGADFAPCRERPTMVFKIPAGKVLYLGSVDYGFEGSMLHISYGNDLTAAQSYVQRTFPALTQPVESLAYELLPTSDGCSGTYIPIYTHR